MKCPKCGGRGFTELEHGLIRVFCDCEKGKALRAEVTGEIAEGGIISDPELGIVSRIERDNKPAGSEAASKPKQPRKPKAGKKPRKRPS